MFNRRALLFGLLALTLGLAGAYLNYEWLSAQAPKTVTEIVKAGPVTVEVVTAQADVGAGEVIRDIHLTAVDWPRDLLPPGALVAPARAEGRVSRRSIATGEPILETALLPEGTEAGLSPIIGDGMRAVAVKVDEVIGIAGFVKPGARVDVLATIKNRRGGTGATYSKVILQDVKVLAIDQSLEKVEAGEPQLVSVVTLEVGPADSQKLTFAAHEGKLQLALRNPADGEEVRTRSVTSATLRGAAPKRKVNKTHVEVIKGLDVSRESF